MPLSALGKTNGVCCQSACTGAGSSRKPRAHMWLHPPFSPQCLLPTVAQWPGAALRDRSQKAEMLCQVSCALEVLYHLSVVDEHRSTSRLTDELDPTLRCGPTMSSQSGSSTRSSSSSMKAGMKTQSRSFLMNRARDLHVTPDECSQCAVSLTHRTTWSRSSTSCTGTRPFPHTPHTPLNLVAPGRSGRRCAHDSGHIHPIPPTNSTVAMTPHFMPLLLPSSPANQDVPAPQPASPCIRIAALFLFLSGAPENMYRLAIVTQHQHAGAKPRLHAYLEEYPRPINARDR